MLPDTLERTTLADLERLATDRVPESVTVDFKRDNYRINNTNADDKKKQCKELLKDTSAFANAHGGDLIIGIEEHQGAAANVVGIQSADIDNLKRQMIAIIGNGTDPKIAFTIHTIAVSADRYAVIIRVRQSSHGPHRVVYQGEQGAFWARDSGGNHEMTVAEIANLARRSKSLEEQIESFRKDRVEAIARNECPVGLSTPQRMVFHLIPEAFGDFQIQSQDLLFFSQWMPMLHDTGGWTHEHNINGMVTYDRDPGIPTSGYVQLYRNGIVESVVDDVTFFHPNDTSHQYRLFRTDYLSVVPPRMATYFKLLKSLAVPLPVRFYMSFVGLDGTQILSSDFLRSQGRPIRERMILTPSQEVDDFGTEIKALLKPGFDMLWNAAGYPNCPLKIGEGT